MGTEEWQSDIEITEETVKSILQEQAPSLMPLKAIQYIGEGWDNKVYLINDSLIFRVPHRSASIKLMERENIVLNHLPIFSNVKTPRLKYSGHPTAKYPFPYQIYEIIRGLSGYRANVDKEDRNKNIVILAEFLRELHSIHEEDARRIGVVSQGSGSRSNIGETIKVLRERVDSIVNRHILRVNILSLQDEINRVKNIILPDRDCLVHGDIDCRHLIFDEKKLTGIIDWGDTDITNRAVDLDILWTFFTEDCHKQFFEIYGSIDPEEWKFARFLGIYCSFSLALYGLDLKDEILFTESVSSIRRINPDILENWQGRDNLCCWI